ncbi:MAG TPA: serine/threonine-protein kinase [Candidatus Obscuribacterales bacterium]
MPESTGKLPYQSPLHTGVNNVRKAKFARQQRASVSCAFNDSAALSLTVEPAPNHADGCKSSHDACGNASDPPSCLDEQHSRLGDYHLLKQCSRDAVSTTFEAKRSDFEGPVAVRIFNERMRCEVSIRQIKSAAQAAADCNHANAEVVYDSGVAPDGSPYVVTEPLNGETLAHLLGHSKRIDIARLLGIISQVCQALLDAHSRKLVHGNLSPSTIILTHNKNDLDAVKVIDFGMPSDPVQNAFYTSLEQSLDKVKMDARSDIYSLGCVMFECLTGTPPFIGHQRSQASLNYLHELANQYSPEAPEHNALKLLDCIIIKCLQQNRSKRFRNVRELMDALKLVNDCIAGGESRKLPRKAEKLLLFRFLDLFDQKIVACAFIYLAVGLCSAKVFSEIQLQKNIDDGQLALISGNLSLAQANWSSAIHQAEVAHKPPSLLADLRWELGDVYAKQSAVSDSETKNALARDAIEQYEQALNYFQRGTHFRSCTVGLLKNIGELWANMDGSALTDARQTFTRKKARAMLLAKNYKECATTCSWYLQTDSDDEISAMAERSYTELARKLPPQTAVPMWERAAYYASLQGHTYDLDELVSKALETGIFDSNTRAWLMSLAMQNGDAEAVLGLTADGFQPPGQNLGTAAASYIELRQEAYSGVPEKGPALTRAIEALQKSLDLEEQANGKHSEKLVPTLCRLAECYVGDGQPRRAMETYRKALYSKQRSKCIGDVLIYTDLLKQAGHPGQASRLLEMQVHDLPDGAISPLEVPLIQAYVQEGLIQTARNAVLNLTHGIEYRPTYIPHGTPPVGGTMEKDDRFDTDSRGI